MKDLKDLKRNEMNNHSQKLLFFDIATTGPSPHKHSIWSMSGILAQIIPGDEVQLIDQLTFTAAPPRGEEMAPSYVNNERITIPELETLESPDSVHNQSFLPFLNKHINPHDRHHRLIIAGYNSGSDARFLSAWFTKRYGPTFSDYFYWHTIDIVTLVMDNLKEDQPKLFRLGVVADYLGLSVNETLLHSTAYDCRLALDVYAVLKGLEINEEQLEAKGGD